MSLVFLIQLMKYVWQIFLLSITEFTVIVTLLVTKFINQIRATAS